jgi:hypothetical protein
MKMQTMKIITFPLFLDLKCIKHVLTTCAIQTDIMTLTSTDLLYGWTKVTITKVQEHLITPDYPETRYFTLFIQKLTRQKNN